MSCLQGKMEPLKYRGRSDVRRTSRGTPVFPVRTGNPYVYTCFLRTGPEYLPGPSVDLLGSSCAHVTGRPADGGAVEAGVRHLLHRGIQRRAAKVANRPSTRRHAQAIGKRFRSSAKPNAHKPPAAPLIHW